MFKKNNLMLITLVFIFIFFTVLPAAAVEVKIQTPTVPAALPFLWMQEKADLPTSIDLNINLASDHQRGISLLAQNDIDFLITGTNVGANAYNRGVDLKMMNVNIWGIDYLLTNDFQADNWTDLKGKEIALPLQGGPLDFLIRYLAQKNGLDPEKDLNLVYRSLPGSARLFMAGKLDSILLPEPLVTISLAKGENTNLAMDIQAEWEKVHGDSRIPFVALFGSTKFIENYPQFTKIINAYYRQGVEWVNNNPTAAAELGAKYFQMPAPILEQSFKRVNLNIYSKAESRSLTELYFGEILEMYPDLLGGSLPDEKFYY